MFIRRYTTMLTQQKLQMKKLLLFITVFYVGLSVTAQEYTIENNEVKLNKKIAFATGSSTLLSESDEALSIIKKYLTDKTYISLLRVEGHTSNAGEADQNLSEKRALAVSRRLIELGIDCKRLIAVGFGNTKPVDENNTPAGKANNTRISFVNAALRNHLIGGLPADGGGKIAGDSCL